MGVNISGFRVNSGWKKIPGSISECVTLDNLYNIVPFNMIVYSWPFEIQHLKLAVTLKNFGKDGALSIYVSKDVPMATRLSLFHEALEENRVYVGYQRCSPASQLQVGNVQTYEFECSCNTLPDCNSVIILVNTNMGEPFYICEITSRPSKLG